MRCEACCRGDAGQCGRCSTPCRSIPGWRPSSLAPLPMAVVISERRVAPHLSPSRRSAHLACLYLSLSLLSPWRCCPDRNALAVSPLALSVLYPSPSLGAVRETAPTGRRRTDPESPARQSRFARCVRAVRYRLLPTHPSRCLRYRSLHLCRARRRCGVAVRECCPAPVAVAFIPLSTVFSRRRHCSCRFAFALRAFCSRKCSSPLTLSLVALPRRRSRSVLPVCGRAGAVRAAVLRPSL